MGCRSVRWCRKLNPQWEPEVTKNHFWFTIDWKNTLKCICRWNYRRMWLNKSSCDWKCFFWTGQEPWHIRRQSEERSGKDARQTDRGRGGRRRTVDRRSLVQQSTNWQQMQVCAQTFHLITDSLHSFWLESFQTWKQRFYLLLFGEDPQTEADRLLIVIHLVVFLVHPLVEGIGV